MMTLKKMINESFEQQTHEIWEQKAEEALKGKSIDSLITTSYEGIQLKPLYTKEDTEALPISQFPGQPDFRRGVNQLGYHVEEWKIAQKIHENDGKILKEKLEQGLTKGQTAIVFATNNMTPNDFEKLVKDVYTKYPFCLETNEPKFLSQLSKLAECKKISGYIASDFVAEIAMNGSEPDEYNYDQWVENLQLAHKNMPKLRTILINTSIYHNGGANAVQELAIALSTGIHYIDQLLKRGLSLETILGKMVFKFSIGANFFMEIAKLRTARLLWSKITEAYGAKIADQKMIISAETSAFTKTVYDPYVNILRAGNEAFAAVLGGIQYLYVRPFNEPEGTSTTFSERIARNTQLILKNEAHLEKVVDPAGGSWYIESLTNELAEKAWALFLEMEEKDGIINVLKNGWLQEQIAEVMNKRNDDISKRKQSIVGTNMYANLNDAPLKRGTSIKTKGIAQVRLSEPFEELRSIAQKIEKSGNKPTIGLICLGELKAHKARADFIASFLSPGGIYMKKSVNIESTEMALQFVKDSKLKHYVICGTDKQYDESALDIAKLIKGNHPNVKIFLAGLPEKKKQDGLEHAGITEFIHIRSNCYETLSSLLSEMEVASNDEKA